MPPTDLSFLESAFLSFVETSVHRVAHSGDMVYRYRITASDIKAKTGRQRLHGAVITECVQFFEHHGAHASYDEKFTAFEVIIDLNRAVLTPSQAKFLSKAMELYRAENQ